LAVLLEAIPVLATMDRKAELEKKRKKLEELRKARESKLSSSITPSSQETASVCE
jgi:hypothetical protein